MRVKGVGHGEQDHGEDERDPEVHPEVGEEGVELGAEGVVRVVEEEADVLDGVAGGVVDDLGAVGRDGVHDEGAVDLAVLEHAHHAYGLDYTKKGQKIVFLQRKSNLYF